MRSTIVATTGLALLGIAAAVTACADDATEAIDGGTSLPEASIDATTDAGPGADAGDAGVRASTCEITRAYFVACGEPLTCGDAKFDAWCDANDRAINSESFRRAQEKCLLPENCDGEKRRRCEYATYASATPTDAQKQVVAAYCQTCEPADPTGCATRKTTYLPGAASNSVDDVFVAAWELSDPIADEIRTQCTGGALDAGDAGCAKAFANCAGGVYVDRLPDCP
ncbi:MAG: hypothetical protein KF819_28570 [Labilithrix sp.]|nr:hypothetical protein [Labilithrix sp.]